jgi:biopolymer transport protein ExbB
MGLQFKMPARVARFIPVSALVFIVMPTIAVAQEVPAVPPLEQLLARDVQRFANQFAALYQRTPWTDRVAWGALIACSLLAVYTIIERTWALRRRRVMPKRFVNRLDERLEDGRLDRAKLLDLCEMNNCAAARVASAVASRWGRSSQDLERALNSAVRVETEELSRNIPTLRRVAILAPMLGLLGSLIIVGRLLQAQDPKIVVETWTTLLAQGLLPLTGGVLVAVLALISYDGLSIRVTKYTNRLEQLGTRLVDQIVMATPPPDPRRMLGAPVLSNKPHMTDLPPRREKVGEYDNYEEQPRRRTSGQRRRKPLDPIDLDDLDD